MPQTKDVREVIKKVVEKQLAPARIVDVSVEEGFDHDGDRILRVVVVFEAEDDRLDPKKVLGLVRHLRKPFQELDEDRFPLFSFMIPSEVNGAAALSDQNGRTACQGERHPASEAIRLEARGEHHILRSVSYLVPKLRRLPDWR